MSRAKDLIEDVENAVLDHFNHDEPGLYSHAEAQARAAAYIPPPEEANASTEAPENPGPSDSPAGPDVKE